MALNLIVGAKGTKYPGWLSTDLRSPGRRLDVRRAEDWARSFAPASVDRMVAEHMLEHMSYQDGLVALHNIRQHLKPGGRVRVAVPDAYNPDPTYQEMCRPGGKGQAWARLFFYADDEPEHQVHYNYQTLSELMRRAGLTPHLLEFHDEHGRFHRNPWRMQDGPISRYYNSPYNLKVFQPFHGYQNLSLLVDGVKSPEGVVDRAAVDYCQRGLLQRGAAAYRPAGRDSTGRIVLLGALAVGGLVALLSSD